MNVARLRELLAPFDGSYEVSADWDEIVITPAGARLHGQCFVIYMATDEIRQPYDPVPQPGDVTIGLQGIGVGAEQAKM